MGPQGPLPLIRQTTENFPENHSQLDFSAYFPAGPKGVSFISPVVFHLPTKKPSFSTSGPGFGALSSALATEAAETSTAIAIQFLVMSGSLLGSPS